MTEKEKIKKFSFGKLESCLFLEKLHRKVYDVFYEQDRKILNVDKQVIKVYEARRASLPEFRTFLVYWKPRITELIPIEDADYKHIFQLLKLNVNRYGSSPYLTFLD